MILRDDKEAGGSDPTRDWTRKPSTLKMLPQTSTTSKDENHFPSWLLSLQIQIAGVGASRSRFGEADEGCTRGDGKQTVPSLIRTRSPGMNRGWDEGWISMGYG